MCYIICCVFKNYVHYFLLGQRVRDGKSSGEESVGDSILNSDAFS